MDRMASIELAMRNEKTEMEWYLNESERSNNPLAKKLFVTLANDEKEHMTRIKGLHAKLTGEGAWPEDLPLDVAGTCVKDVLDELLGKVGSAEGHDDDDLAALNRASNFEDKGSKFYAELAGECENPQERKFFSFLSGIEREHYLSIKDSLFYLEDPEGWTESKERQGLDGAS